LSPLGAAFFSVVDEDGESLFGAESPDEPDASESFFAALPLP
jgi:hypothetical protein